MTDEHRVPGKGGGQQMQPCPDCGHLMPAGANFCDRCGERLRPEPPPAPRTEPPPDDPRPLLSSTTWIWVLSAVGLLIAIGVGAALVMNEPSDSTDSESAGPDDTTTEPGQPPTTTPDPADVLASKETARIRMTVFNCGSCEITAFPGDGSEPQTATVAAGAVEFALPVPATLGLGFTVTHPDGFGAADGSNVVVLSPAGFPAGTAVRVADVVNAEAVRICWAGTLQTTVTLAINADLFNNGTPTGGLRTWADPGLPTLPVTTVASANGTVDAPALSACATQDEDG